MIELDEGTAARRRVPMRLFASDGTSPDTGALNDAVIMGVNSLGTISLTSTCREVHAAQGMYAVELTQSETSVLGIHPLYHTVGSFPQHVANAVVVNSNPYSSQSNIPLVATVTDVTNQVTADMTAISGDATAANNLEAAFDGTGYDSALTTFVKDSVATIAGVTNVSTEIGALNDIDGSNVTLHAGVHSGATIQGVELVDLTTANTDMVGTDDALQPSTLGRTLDVTVGGTAGIDWANVEAPTTEVDLSATTINQAATIGAGGIASTTFAAAAIDAASLAADAGAELADAHLDRDMSTGADSGSSAVRTPRDAFRSLRNRVDLSENTLTVFEEDDVTEAWRASLTTTGDSNFPTAMDPSG